MRHFRFKEGRNCWRVARTERLSALVDGEAYFAAVRRALIAARRRIFILAWDIHSQVELIRDAPQTPGDGLPTQLAELLVARLEANPDLEVYILLWSYAPIYALEREPLFFGESPWDGHPRLHFAEDNTHPLAASHHQKLVVIDGRIAFCGGIDLSKWRWDTTEHLAEEPRRVDTDGRPYQPFHDIQLLVDGEAAVALEALALSRWSRATGQTLEPTEPPGTDKRSELGPDPWPELVDPLLRGHQCAIARTYPEYGEQGEVREVERLYLDMIDTAKRFIYIENQYLTSDAICDALRAGLRRRHGPEVVIILPSDTGGWLEQHTMDVLRARKIRELRDDDRHGRLRIYAPRIRELKSGCLMVHAKLMIVDDALLRIGSSNLSNRSMGLDTECDLCLRADDESARASITGLRQGLIGILLGMDAQRVAQAEEREQGLIAAIESLPQDGQTLSPLSGETDPEWDRQLPDHRLIDPSGPLSAADLGNSMVGRHMLPHARRRFWVGVGLVLMMLALAAVWRWTDVGAWLEPQALAGSLKSALNGPWGPGLLAAVFVVGSLIAVPVTLLILVTALAYGPVLGTLYALGGSVLAAVVTYGIGHYLGRSTVERLSGGRARRWSERLARSGILTIVAVRIIPVAPFTVINLFAGASRISFRDYLIGTLIGMVPGVAAMAVFAEGILALLSDADLIHFLVVALALVFIVGLTLLARHFLAQANGRHTSRDRYDHAERRTAS